MNRNDQPPSRANAVPPDDAGIPTDQIPAWVRARASELVGRTISDRYRINEVIAMGGMGAVYRGEHVHMRKAVAVKVLHPATRGFAELAARFEREAVAGAHIRHPNVVSATDFGRLPDGSYFLVLEYVRGATLHSLIRRGHVAPFRAARIARQIAAALGAGHEMGVIHRDVKPRNVMLIEGENDVVKLIDFGLAKVPVERLATVDGNDPLGKRVITGMGVVFGTVAYMAPETALGMDAVDHRSDLYALGIILYEMLAGAHPFDGADPGELFLKQRTEQPPPFRVRAPYAAVPPDLEAVTMRMLEKIPEARFQSAREVIAALDAATPFEAVAIAAPPEAPLSVAVAGAVPSSVPSPAGPRGTSSRPPGRAISGSHPRLPPIPRPPRLPSLSPPPLPTAPPSTATARAPRRDRNRAVFIAIPLAAFAVSGALLALLIRHGRAEEIPRARIEASIAPFVRRGGEVLAASERSAEQRDAAELRAKIEDASAQKDGRSGAKAIVALAEIDPEAFRDRDLFAATLAVLVRVPLDASDEADSVFDAVAASLGSVGPDLLYEIVNAHVGTKASTLAEDRLHRRDVLERASPALRVAWGLHEATCEEKPAWFDRAGSDGDARALAMLEVLRSSRCNARIGQCCFHRNGLLDEAIATLRARMRKAP